LPAISQSDPQTAVLSDIIPIPTGVIRTGLVVLVAVAMELGSSLGLYVSTSAWNDPGNKDNDDPRRRENEIFEGLSARLDALFSRIDEIVENQTVENENIDDPLQDIGDDDIVHVSLTEKGRKMVGMPPLPSKPRLVAQDGELVKPSTVEHRRSSTVEKRLVVNRDPAAIAHFADPALVDRLRTLGGGYEGALANLAKDLHTSVGTLYKKLTQAQAAGRIAWQSKPGVGTSIKLIE
jgi:hypothetical protein